MFSFNLNKSNQRLYTVKRAAPIKVKIIAADFKLCSLAIQAFDNPEVQIPQSVHSNVNPAEVTAKRERRDQGGYLGKDIPNEGGDSASLTDLRQETPDSWCLLHHLPEEHVP